MKMKNTIWLSLAVVLLNFITLHFVVAEEPPAAPPRTCTGAAEFSFVSTGGNTDTMALGLAGTVECKPGLWSYLTKVAYVRNETDDLVTAKSIDASFRASREITQRLKGYGQFGYYQNEFAGIDQRYAVEGGVSYLLYSNARHSLTADGGFGYTRENRIAAPPAVAEDLDFATARVGGSYRWKLSDTAEVGEDAGFLFDLNEGSNWRFANAIYVAAKINAIFSLKVSNAVAYLNQPAPGFGKTDTITSAAVVAKF
jgi:putative salt-induced outer membrane protein